MASEMLFTDVKVVAGLEPSFSIRTHRGVLAAASSVFHGAFTSGASLGEDESFTLPNKSAADVELLQKCLYPTTAKSDVFSAEVIPRVLELANEYGLSAVSKEAEDWLCFHADMLLPFVSVRGFINNELWKVGKPALSFLLLASKYQLIRFEDECIERFKILSKSELLWLLLHHCAEGSLPGKTATSLLRCHFF